MFGSFPAAPTSPGLPPSNGPLGEVLLKGLSIDCEPVPREIGKGLPTAGLPGADLPIPRKPAKGLPLGLFGAVLPIPRKPAKGLPPGLFGAVPPGRFIPIRGLPIGLSDGL